MLVGCIGTACFERPTLVLTSSYSPTDFVSHNKKYEDYISSFDNANRESNVQELPNTAAQDNSKPANVDIDEDVELAPEVMDRLDTYASKTETVIDKMFDIMRAVDSFEPLEQNAGEMEREKRSQQALAINNKATSLNKKTLGLFHPHESSEAHSEIIQATESLRLAAYSLYTYTLQEDASEQVKQYSQCRSQIAQAKNFLERFWNDIENLKSNYQPQQEAN